MWHFIHVDGDGAHYNDTRGLLYEEAGPSYPGAIDSTTTAGADSTGLSLKAGASDGDDFYGEYDKDRGDPAWQAYSVGHLEFSPVDNLAQFGWDKRYVAGGKISAAGLAWLLRHRRRGSASPRRGHLELGSPPLRGLRGSNLDFMLPASRRSVTSSASRSSTGRACWRQRPRFGVRSRCKPDGPRASSPTGPSTTAARSSYLTGDKQSTTSSTGTNHPALSCWSKRARRDAGVSGPRVGKGPGPGLRSQDQVCLADALRSVRGLHAGAAAARLGRGSRAGVPPIRPALASPRAQTLASKQGTARTTTTATSAAASASSSDVPLLGPHARRARARLPAGAAPRTPAPTIRGDDAGVDADAGSGGERRDGRRGGDAGCGSASDPENCGSCGHSCKGTACVAGRRADGALPAARQPVHGADHAGGEHVFWNDNHGQVWRGPRAGGTATLTSTESNKAIGMAFSDGALFWADCYGNSVRMAQFPTEPK